MRRLFRLMAEALLAVCFLAQPHTGEAAIRIGLLPAADTLLLIVAKEEGLFAARDLDIELVPFMSSLEQGTALLAGRLDGTFTDIIRVLLLNEAGADQKIVATTFHASPGHRYFGLAVSPQSARTTPADSAGMEVGISTATIIEYVYERMLREQGLDTGHMRPVSLDKIPIRLQMLLSGRLEAAILPEPHLSLAERRGARVLWDDGSLNTALAVVALNSAVLGTPNGAAVAEALRDALAEAAQRINADPVKYRALMVEKKLLPAALADDYAMMSFDPRFVPNALPDSGQLQSYAAWMREHNLVKRPPEVSDLLR